MPPNVSNTQHIRISNASVWNTHEQVTNAGVGSLSERCPLLAHLKLNRLKYVTDVALARLGAGCPRLSYLDLSGLVMLSDGTQRDFALTGLQVKPGAGGRRGGFNMFPTYTHIRT